MSIKYDPKRMIGKLVPKAQIRRMLRGNVTLKKTALTYIDRADFIDRKDVNDVALKVINRYKERIAEASDGLSKAEVREIRSEIVDDPRLLIQRVQNEVSYQIKEKIKEKYKGKRAIWLPSDANEPDPEHQLNYGKEYEIGVGINGEEPGDREGCLCGMEILTEETELDLSES